MGGEKVPTLFDAIVELFEKETRSLKELQESPKLVKVVIPKEKEDEKKGK